MNHVLQPSKIKIDTYSVDHHYRGEEQSDETVILYGQMGTAKFVEFHNKLKALAEDKKIDYVLRHYVKVWNHLT